MHGSDQMNSATVANDFRLTQNIDNTSLYNHANIGHYNMVVKLGCLYEAYVILKREMQGL